MKRLALITVLAATLAGSALAQSPKITIEAPKEPASEVKLPNGDVVVRYVTPTETDFIASSLIDTKVLNKQDQAIGQIKDIIIRQNNVAGIVVGVGGFLGVGERYVVVDPSTIYMRHENGAWKVVVNVTKEGLMAAPEFKYEEHKKL
ncbi:PRC-barrel domain-containing protein [Bartonella sp. M0177]|uniref:PRC-barrel domain-containing protein n=1 Tax=Bartonella sp. M0177 TaxID=2750940 RepID=UPI0018DDD200|nr:MULTISPECIES: PRC-barrel domain-containing protein [Bartonella]MBI0003951.1 PRC-barrel domain-containing protein [Bartonella sp. M0177]WLT07965.1 PRC-barrel domain-containing protein [Bartonella apihabitans]